VGEVSAKEREHQQEVKMGLGRRTALHHQTVASAVPLTSDFGVGERVMTVDGFSGQIEAVLDGPVAGVEAYRVVLDNGLGGGEYTRSQVRALMAAPQSTASTEALASRDYPELGSILFDRPDIAPDQRMASRKQRHDDSPHTHTYGHGGWFGAYWGWPHTEADHDELGEPEDHDADDAVSGSDGDADDSGGGSATASLDPALYDVVKTARADSDFAFHVTASWSDVRAKAKRLRAEGRVHVSSASEGLVIAQVNGDKFVYETGIQRLPGSTAISAWSCGCRWGAYHWGAEDDNSRFAGRMCSHALAVRYEAQSRGMFGKDVYADHETPDWVPRRVVVKYEPETGRNLRAPSTRTSAYAGVPMDHLVSQASMVDDPDEVALFVRTAAVNNPWGEPQARPPVYHVGPTEPHDPNANPASTGWAAGPDPQSWSKPLPSGEISTSVFSSRQVLDDEALFESVPLSRWAKAEKEPPAYSGLALKAADTGRLLMLQRSMKDEKDPAKGTWEFPGGGHEAGDQTSLHAAVREWEEEIGQPFPHGGHVSHVWRSGPWQGHLVVVPNEDSVSLHEGRVMTNPDDPDGDDAEQAAWWDPAHAQSNPALRKEVKGSPWEAISKAAIFVQAETATMNEEPEGALPTTDGMSDEDNESLSPANASIEQIVAQFQATAGASLMAPPAASDDIAEAAKAHLAKTALKDFTAAERQALIEEGVGVRASNLDRLEIGDTHYAMLTDDDDEDSWTA
jgi:8-oxo-dGTP pyrophosphatase MutT (NUDIX family)